VANPTAGKTTRQDRRITSPRAFWAAGTAAELGHSACAPDEPTPIKGWIGPLVPELGIDAGDCEEADAGETGGPDEDADGAAALPNRSSAAAA